MEKSKHKRQSKPEINIPMIFGFVFLCAISVCIYPVVPRYNMTPFFRAIENGSTYDERRDMEAEAESLILEHLTIGQSTKDDVRNFVEQRLFRWAGHKSAGNGIRLPHCDYYPQSMTCHTTESVVVFEETRWIIRFEFDNDVLTAIDVSIVVYGLQ